MNPTRELRYHHTMTLDFWTSNKGIDDFGRAAEPYTRAEAKRYAERVLKDSDLFGPHAYFEHAAIAAHHLEAVYAFQPRRRLPLLARRSCEDCGKRRDCFKVYPPRRPKQARWLCASECASGALYHHHRLLHEGAS
jgi:hypothetical protein